VNRASWRGLALVALLACGGSGCAAAGTKVGDAGGAGGNGFRDDRVVLSRYNEVSGVAVGRRWAFVATPRGLAVFDRQFESWLPPLAPDDGYPRNTGQRIVLAADPATDAVWIGGFGELVSYRPDIGAVQRSLVPGQVEVILFDSRDPLGGAFVRSAGQWTRVTETGFTSPVDASQLPPAGSRVVPPTPEQVFQEFPALRSFQGLLTRDEGSLRSWPLSAVARAPERSEVWLGTWGGGAFQVDPQFSTSRPRPFGLLTDDASAVALAADGVWIAGGASYGTERGGLVFASTSLQQWRWLEQERGPLLGTRANDLQVRGTRAWVATDRGVARLDTRVGTDVRAWTGTNGLPADAVYAVAPRERGAWVGTARGLVWVSDSAARRANGRAEDVSAPVVPDVRVRALLLTGDTLWIGSDGGLLLLPPSRDVESARPVRAAAASQEPRLLDPVTAIARSDSLVVIATRDALVRLDLRTGRLLPRLLMADIGQLGGVAALAVDERTIWLAGPRGLLVVTRGADVVRFVPVGAGAVGAAVSDVVLAGEYAWVATTAGLVRLRRRADGTPP